MNANLPWIMVTIGAGALLAPPLHAANSVSAGSRTTDPDVAPDVLSVLDHSSRPRTAPIE